MDSKKEFKKIPILCPRCKGVLLHWNGITMMQVATQCRNCGRYYTFNPTTEDVKAGKRIERATSSGVRFM